MVKLSDVRAPVCNVSTAPVVILSLLAIVLD